MKKVPNPYGKKGCPQHTETIMKLFKELEMLYHSVIREYRIDIDEKKKRYADITALDENNIEQVIIQVGITNKNGEPVSRERQAIEEIEKATGKKVRFVAYKTLIILILIAAGWYVIV